ncbi:uncharacterized protein LOC110446244 [Mizuhopecten yessoensis]|uniref:uncharacterized protein LOC110446244 n=1 Tax=Mizuhopecten yessoensis TaxID=6573 RepID=UPI000B45D859|nr:uncharacterized protein LOC110446244 [Mizuhopecten yessoensis]
MTLILHELQTFQIQSTSDLSGVKIISINKKSFSVISGSSYTSIQNGGLRDYMADMVPPIATWGSEYVLVRRNLPQFLRDYVKFVAAASGANISSIGCGPVLYHLIQEFQTYLFSMTCERVYVISDEPVLIAHFPVGVGHGDPAMLFPTPVYHYVSKYTVYIPPGFRSCSIALVMETMQVNTFSFTRFSASFTPWEVIEQSVYSTSWVKNVNSGVVEITHTSPFGGHMICERDSTIITSSIGLGNVTVKEPQEYSTSTMADISTTQNVNETLIDGDSTNTRRTTATKVVTESSTSTDGIIVSSNVTSDVTTSQTQRSGSESMLNCSCCKSPSYSDSDLPPPEILLEITNELKKTLTVPKTTTSNYVRKHTCAWDTRTSSAGIGVMGIVILCVVLGSIITLDLVTLFQKRR